MCVATSISMLATFLVPFTSGWLRRRLANPRLPKLQARIRRSSFTAMGRGVGFRLKPAKWPYLGIGRRFTTSEMGILDGKLQAVPQNRFPGARNREQLLRVDTVEKR